MRPCKKKQIDEVISYLQKNHFDAENEFTEPVYRKVICGFLHESVDISTVAEKTDKLRHILYRYRETLSKEIIGYNELNWEQRKNDAADLIEQASELLDDPILGTDSLEIAKLLNLPDDHPSLKNLRKPIAKTIHKRIQHSSDVEKLADLDILAIAIWQIAQAIRDTPTEKITPLKARSLKQAIPGQQHIGQPHEREGYTANDASKTKKSSRAVLIRRIDRALSENTENRFSVISDLVNLAESMQEEAWRRSLKNNPKPCTRQDVRSIINARASNEKSERKKEELINKFLFKKNK